MKKPFRGLLFAAVSLAGMLAAGCGDVPNLGGRPTPPDFDKLGLPRAMVAVQSNGTSGFLQFLDVLHNTASNKENTVHSYTVSGFTGTNPVTIQDYPGVQAAYVYSSGNGQFQLINTGTDAAGSAVAGLQGLSSSIYISPDFQYTYASNPLANGGYLTVIYPGGSQIKKIALSNISRIAMSPGGTAVLAFEYYTNNVYQLNGINATDITNDSVTQLSGTFDMPVNAVYSADGAYAYVLNCGPQCGGVTASISVFSLTQVNGVYPEIANVPIPGGAYYAIQNGNNLYVAGMQAQSGSFTGMLTQVTINASCLAGISTSKPDQGDGCFPITNTLAIGDGNAYRMKFADDNTLWIGSKNCANFLRGLSSGSTGCITDVTLDSSGNLSAALIEGSHGDCGGIAPIQQAGTKYTYGHEVYTTEGGQVYIYASADGSPIDASLVQVVGYATDIAFVDGIYNYLP